VGQGAGTPTLRDYLNVLWRRKWIVVQAVVLVPLVAALVSVRQPAMYNASARVLLRAQNLPANLEGVYDPTQQNATRVASTQAQLARAPEVARKTVSAAGLSGWSGSELLGISAVAANPDTDILTFSVTYRDPAVATRLATEYARQAILYWRDLDRGALKAAQAAVEGRIASLAAAGNQSSPLYRTLVQQRQRLETMQSLLAPRAVLVQPATGAGQVQPHVRKNVFMGLVLGLVLGLGLALLWEALDSRVRSAEPITARLRLPLLGRLPRPPRRLRRMQRLIMQDDPTGPHAEAFRILRTNFEFANLGTAARSVMVTSAVEKEGKSTTVANLALVLARAGRRVTLVDLDLRSASLHRFLGVDPQPGITDVALGDVPLDGTLVRVDLGDPESPRARSGGYGVPEGSLQFLPAGSLQSNPGEFISRLRLKPILDELHRQSDIVLIDGPPLLRVGDAIAVSSRVDALVVVTRLNMVRFKMLDDLGRVLRSCPVAKLGVIVAGADVETGYGYLTYPYESATRPLEVSPRPPG
jgi:succinoglycan biosynthesis transport protein ExoP